MPFRNRDWEDFQRDCDFFPAYTDYVFGVDTRAEVAEEPGLHPQVYDLPLPPQYIYGLPTAVQYPTAYDPVPDASHARPCTMLPQSGPLLRHESSLESLLPTPTPAPRVLPTPGPPMALLRPGELAADPAYSFIPQQERVVLNRNIIQACSLINSDAIPAQKAKAMGYLKNTSRMVALKRQEYQDHRFARLEAQEAEAEQEAELQEPQRLASSYYDMLPLNEARQAEAEAERAAERVLASHEYAIRDISQLPAYVQSRLSQLWTCTDIVALQAPPTDPAQLNVRQQAQQYLMAFTQSVPPNGRQWVGLVIDGMLKLRNQGVDPLMVLENMPSVESTYETGLEDWGGA